MTHDRASQIDAVALALAVFFGIAAAFVALSGCAHVPHSPCLVSEVAP